MSVCGNDTRSKASETLVVARKLVLSDAARSAVADSSDLAGRRSESRSGTGTKLVRVRKFS